MDNSMFSLKYRPYSFDKMIGQKGIIGEFKNRSISENYPQVMIFEGPSGSGKTSLALILAGLINCKKPVKVDSGDGIPYMKSCGNCSSCKDIKGEVFSRDVQLYDASSMNKDDVLSLRDNVDIDTFYDKNKIIIIDEAQELSKAGKGATLRLLEKKRKNVYFILCTMNFNILNKELKKALKSRGQTYKFRGVLSQDIAEYLYNVLKEEGLNETVPEKFITEGLFVVSSYAEGNVRDALQYLERCIVGNYYSKDDILREFGFITEEKAIELIMKILNKDKSFFTDIRKLEIKDFYFYSWKILLETNLYSFTGYVEEKWQQNSYEQFIKKPGLYDLLKIYGELYKDIGIYFKDNLYLSRILDFFKSSVLPPEKKVRKTESPPVRPVR